MKKTLLFCLTLLFILAACSKQNLEACQQKLIECTKTNNYGICRSETLKLKVCSSYVERERKQADQAACMKKTIENCAKVDSAELCNAKAMLACGLLKSD